MVQGERLKKGIERRVKWERRLLRNLASFSAILGVGSGDWRVGPRK